MNRILLFVMICIFTFQSCIKQDTITYQAQFKSDTASISSFVGSNNPAAIKLKSGIWYSIDDLRNGVYPALSDEVTISYKVKWIQSTSLKETDLDSVGYSTSTQELLSAAISGLQQGLILFPDSSVGRIYIPSGLAFGTSAHYDTTNVNIHPNSNLLYEITLVSVKGTRLTTDITTIDSYLQSHSIDKVLHDESGIRYTIDTTGQTSHRKPRSVDSFLVTYQEKILTADTLTASVDTQTKIALKDQVTAWRIMLPKYMTEGSTITMYTPSGYAYGNFGKQGIPVNSNMVYVITLIKIN